MAWYRHYQAFLKFCLSSLYLQLLACPIQPWDTPSAWPMLFPFSLSPCGPHQCKILWLLPRSCQIRVRFWCAPAACVQDRRCTWEAGAVVSRLFPFFQRQSLLSLSLWVRRTRLSCHLRTDRYQLAYTQVHWFHLRRLAARPFHHLHHRHRHL